MLRARLLCLVAVLSLWSARSARAAPPDKAETWSFAPLPQAPAPALDLSPLLEAPAGRRGAVRATPDGHLAFADGTRARFFGVNLVAPASFPDHATADRLATRLARLGVNLVRFTHLDASWAPRNLFAPGGTRKLSAENLERLDYLLAQLQKRGIYVFLTLLSARRFQAADGVPDAEALAQGGSLVAHFDPRLIQLQKDHAAALLRHVNPYTGRALADDPQLALLEITNEDSLFAVDRYAENLPPRYRAALLRMLRRSEPTANLSARPLSAATRRALLGVERAYFATMRESLRDLGVKVPIGNSNWFDGLGPALAIDAEGDFVSRQGYWDHPQGGWSPKDPIKNQSVLLHPLDGPIAHLAPLRVVGRPFVVTEWGFCWPNDFIAEGPLLMAAYARAQDWDALIAFNFLGPDWSPTLGGGLDNEVFDSSAKPQVAAQLPAAALLFLGPGAAPAPDATRTLSADALVFAPGDRSGFIDVLQLFDAHDAYERRLGVRLQTADVVPGKAELATPEWRPRAVLTAPGLTWDQAAGVLTIDTPGVAAVVGACAARAGTTLGGVGFDLQTPFCAVSVAALPQPVAPGPAAPAGAPLPPTTPKLELPTLAAARRLLVTAVGRAQNSNMAFSADRRRLRDLGSAPILLHTVRGALRLPAPLAVHPLAEDGTRRPALPPAPTLNLPVHAPSSPGPAPALWYEVRR